MLLGLPGGSCWVYLESPLDKQEEIEEDWICERQILRQKFAQLQVYFYE